MGEIRFRQLSIGALWRIGLICGGCLWLPFGVVVGVLALLGGSTVRLNQQPVHGIAALATAVVHGVVFTLLSGLAILVGAILSRVFMRLVGDRRLRLLDGAPLPEPVAPRPATRAVGSPDETEMGW